ncbi:Fic family protein [Micrococcus luteus]|uniref:Fic family protein n=1 Tax=Micrococcus luteus TaxID=1270 RepID=UPI0021AB2047|nr:Fic family protein [Micrococcus luteus]
MDGQEHARPGAYRDAQGWIGGGAPTPHTAQFVPPHPERLRAGMDDLFAYLRRTDVPALVQAAIAHAQFETIHPFADGNGRTGRVLVHAVLHRAGAITRMGVPSPRDSSRTRPDTSTPSPPTATATPRPSCAASRRPPWPPSATAESSSRTWTRP